MTDPVRHGVETASGAVVASSYFWLHTINEVVGTLAGLAGLIYMLLKIWQVIRELRTPRVGGIVLLILLAAPAVAHDPLDDPEIAQWLRGLVSPLTGGSCCSEHDCAITDYRATRDGIEALAPTGAWVPVPPATVLRGVPNPTGRGVLCWNGSVLCFIEATGV